MIHAFISGIPASGKSYLASRVTKNIGIRHMTIDDWREEFCNDPELKKWVNFFSDKNEVEYWQATNCEKHWENLKKQSKALWPAFLKQIKEIQSTGKPTLFEGVNILPHLAKKDLDFQGIFLLGKSWEEIFERNKLEPRWGMSEKLQKKEAEVFYSCEGPMYKKEAEQYGYKTFTNIEEAEQELLKMLTK